MIMHSLGKLAYASGRFGLSSNAKGARAQVTRPEGDDSDRPHECVVAQPVHIMLYVWLPDVIIEEALCPKSMYKRCLLFRGL
jgi:hypothetical protein